MHLSYLEVLRDPVTKEPLHLVDGAVKDDFVESGFLASAQSRYPIVRGIPRFVEMQENYAASFGYQWRKWPRIQFERENVGGSMEGYTRRMWETITQSPPAGPGPKPVLLDL